MHLPHWRPSEPNMVSQTSPLPPPARLTHENESIKRGVKKPNLAGTLTFTVLRPLLQ